jgi:predicted nucleotidyltransferase component of viral defense system
MLTGKGVISPEQKAVAEAFSRIPDSTRFYLTGGTALAEFYFGHRRSYDLDFFTGDSGLVLPFSRQLESSLSGSGIAVRPIRRLNSFAEFSCACCGTETRLQLAYDSPFRFGPPEETDLGVLVNDYQDLAIDKLMAFFGRCTHRDTVDLFLILQKEKTDEGRRRLACPALTDQCANTIFPCLI